MWPLILAKILKNWKIVLGSVLLVTLCGAILVQRSTIKTLTLKNENLSFQVGLVQEQANNLKASLDKQSAAVLEMKRLADERQERLDALLSQPPRIIYRDKIVEVPSIVTGPCEQVMVDIAAYVRGVMQ